MGLKQKPQQVFVTTYGLKTYTFIVTYGPNASALITTYGPNTLIFITSVLHMAEKALSQTTYGPRATFTYGPKQFSHYYIPRRKSGIYWIQVRRAAAAAAAAVEISLWTR